MSFLLRLAEGDPKTVSLDPVKLVLDASAPVKITVGILVVMSTMVWVIGVMKIVQLARMRGMQQDFERQALRMTAAEELFELASANRDVPGSRVLARMTLPGARSVERLKAVAERAVVGERQRASSLMSPLATIASSSPFVGLFGTVYGIMDAFIRIAKAQSASLQVVAPSIGEALITTAIGLACAIPAVVFYNAADKRISDFVAELEATANEWVMVVADGSSQTARVASNRPPAAPQAPAQYAR